MVCLKFMIVVCYHYILYTLYRAAPTEARRGWLSTAMLRFALACEKQFWRDGIGNTSNVMRDAI